MKIRLYFATATFLAFFISCTSDSFDDNEPDPSQDWETLNESYTYVYNISNFENKLYITGLKDGDFIFASSEDNGVNWNEVVLNESISLENGIPICVGFVNAQEGFIGVKGSFTQQYLKTTDGGLTWEDFEINLNDACDNIPQPQEIVVLDASTLVFSQFQSGNYIISRDGGSNWECNTDFSVANLPKLLAFDANRFLNYDQEGIFESSNQGSDWTSVLDVSGLSTYEMYDQMSGFAITSPFESADSNPQLYITNNTWNTFEKIPVAALEGKLVNSIVPVTEDEIFFFESENVYASNDGGNSVSLVQTIDFEPTHAKKVNGHWYVTGRGLARYNPDGK